MELKKKNLVSHRLLTTTVGAFFHCFLVTPRLSSPFSLLFFLLFFSVLLRFWSACSLRAYFRRCCIAEKKTFFFSSPSALLGCWKKKKKTLVCHHLTLFLFFVVVVVDFKSERIASYVWQVSSLNISSRRSIHFLCVKKSARAVLLSVFIVNYVGLKQKALLGGHTHLQLSSNEFLVSSFHCASTVRKRVGRNEN